MSDDNDKLVKMELPERTLAVKELAGNSGKRADTALAAIADVEGDQSAIQILQQLNPIEIGQILKGHDVSVPAISAWLAEPEKLAAMLVMDPLDWGSQVIEDNVFEIQHNALQLLAQLILSTEDESRRKAVFEALAADENSFFYLCLPFIGLGQGGSVETETNISSDDEDTDDRPFAEEDSSPMMATRPGFRTHNQLAADLMAVIKETVPSLAERIKIFISVEDPADSEWLKVLDHIKDLLANAQQAIDDEGDDDDDYETMFEKPKS